MNEFLITTNITQSLLHLILVLLLPHPEPQPEDSYEGTLGNWRIRRHYGYTTY